MQAVSNPPTLLNNRHSFTQISDSLVIMGGPLFSPYMVHRLGNVEWWFDSNPNEQLEHI